MADLDYLNKVYKSVTGHGGDPEGLDFWAKGLESGKYTKENIAKHMAGAVTPETIAMWESGAVTEAMPTTQPVKESTLSDVTPYVPATVPAFNLAKPEAIAAPYTAPTYTAPTYTPDPSKLPSAQMESLMAKNSPYLQQAARAGERTAQARGLLHSSLAAGAAQGAAMDRALPLAQADADVYTQAGMTGYQGDITTALKGMDAESQHNLTVLQSQINADLAYQQNVQSDYLNQRNTTLQGMISSGLSGQEAAQILRNIEYQGLINSGLSTQEADQTLKNIEYQGLINAGLSTQEANQTLRNIEYQGLINAGLSDQQAQDKLDQIAASSANALVLDEQQQIGANYRAELERDLNIDKLEAADRDAVSTAMTNYGIQFQQDVSNIQRDEQTSGTEKSAKILVAQQVYQSNMDNIAALYAVELAWDTPFVPGENAVEDTPVITPVTIPNTNNYDYNGR